MTFKTFEKWIESEQKFDIPFEFLTETGKGWKVSIIGRSTADALELYRRLKRFLFGNRIPFKVATRKRFNHSDPEQSIKAFTIYCPDELDVIELCKMIGERIRFYKGGRGVFVLTGYTRFEEGLFFRRDRDKYGNYIPAKNGNSTK